MPDYWIVDQKCPVCERLHDFDFGGNLPSSTKLYSFICPVARIVGTLTPVKTADNRQRTEGVKVWSVDGNRQN